MAGQELSIGGMVKAYEAFSGGDVDVRVVVDARNTFEMISCDYEVDVGNSQYAMFLASDYQSMHDCELSKFYDKIDTIVGEDDYGFWMFNDAKAVGTKIVGSLDISMRD
jgi:hypothetical protein